MASLSRFSLFFSHERGVTWRSHGGIGSWSIIGLSTGVFWETTHFLAFLAFSEWGVTTSYHRRRLGGSHFLVMVHVKCTFYPFANTLTSMCIFDSFLFFLVFIHLLVSFPSPPVSLPYITWPNRSHDTYNGLSERAHISSIHSWMNKFFNLLRTSISDPSVTPR